MIRATKLSMVAWFAVMVKSPRCLASASVWGPIQAAVTRDRSAPSPRAAAKPFTVEALVKVTMVPCSSRARTCSPLGQG